LRLQIDKRGICTLSGTELAYKTPPPLAVRPPGKGYWQFYWDDLPAFLKTIKKPETDDLSRANLKELVARQKQVIKVARDELRPENDVSDHFEDEYKPRHYQLIAGQQIYEQGRLLLADSVGLGKTMSAWCGAEMMAKHAGAVKVVVVCPASLKRQWKTEIFWYTGWRVPVFNADGNKAARTEVYRRFLRSKGCAAIAVNYELLIHDEEILEDVFADASYVIADEASRIKTRTSKTAKLLKSMTKDIRWKVAVTATPIEVGVENLYSLMEWLDPWLMGTQTMFNGVYCKTATMLLCQDCGKMRYIQSRRRQCPICVKDAVAAKQDHRLVGKKLMWVKGKSFTKNVGYTNLEHLARRMYGRLLRRRPQDVGNELPQIVASIRYVELTKEQRLVYKAAADGSLRIADNGETNPMVATLDACRACLSPTLFGPGDPGAKTTEVVNMLTTEAAGEKTLIFSESKKYLKQELIPALTHAGVKAAALTGDESSKAKEKVKRGFNDTDDVRVLVMTSAGERGHNLPCGLVLDLDLPWNPSRIIQRAGRARRMGSEYEVVRLINILARDTVEERVVERILGRQSMSEIVVGAEESDVVGVKLSAAEVRKLL
jgi:SNF2 family DNA or RNA helicase